MDPIEVTFQDGENGNTLRVKVPMMPIQMQQHFGRGWYDHAEEATAAVLRAISLPPMIIYNPVPSPGPNLDRGEMNRVVTRIPGDVVTFDRDIPYVDELGHEVRKPAEG